tara:strand:- start:3048 stop:3362 length:315 start_codon:yes stop_codon:yes gene_type:complete
MLINILVLADVEEILKAEVTVLQAIRFQLKVYSPYRSLCGFVEAVKVGICLGDSFVIVEVIFECYFLALYFISSREEFRLAIIGEWMKFIKVKREEVNILLFAE